MQRSYEKVSNRKRVEVIIAACEFNLPCRYVATLFDVLYNNVKTIKLRYKRAGKVLLEKSNRCEEKPNFKQAREYVIQTIVEAID